MLMQEWRAVALLILNAFHCYFCVCENEGKGYIYIYIYITDNYKPVIKTVLKDDIFTTS